IFSDQKVNTNTSSAEKQNVSLTFKISLGSNVNPSEVYLAYTDTRQNPANNNVWGIDKISLKTANYANGIATFNFTIEAPSEPGTYHFQWQIQYKGTFYGDAS